MTGPGRVTVVGASLAGLSTVRALRAEGYDGSITVVGEERHRPYDRPPLSKDFLTGGVQSAELALCDLAEERELAVDWLLGERAVRLDPAARSVTLAGGRELRTDAVVVATGATPRLLPGFAGLAGVHTLRTLDDAQALRADLRRGQPRVVVIGAGFIGAEVASSARALGLTVTVVEAGPVPLQGPLGPELARLCAALHGDHGVTLICGATVAGPTADGGRVSGVRLADGRLLPAEVVVLGVGVRPATDWLAGSGLKLDGGVVCDTGCASSLPQVLAVGDVARGPGRAGHWTNAVEQPKTAARTLLGRAPGPAAVPYFWSDQYGVRIQLAGHVAPGDRPALVDGDYASRSFAAVYRRDGREVAVLAMNRPKVFTRLRRALSG